VTTQRQPKRPTRRQQKGGAQLEGARGLDQWVTIYKAYNAVFKVAELSLLPQRLSLPQLHLLAILKKAGGILTTGEIGLEMIKASQTITGLVDRLEAPGFVERVFDRSDRRKTWVRMTEKGDRKLAEAFPVANRLAEELSSVFTDQELRDLQAKLEKLRSAATDRLAGTLTSSGSIAHGRGV
jgi:MarR family 2-MHQ and catechol resistance regulon transcriptional repressor